ncbi:DUF6153 family protein [Lacisediminihabitans sp.]|uniref:DUF6153 family protein n=1 Tax=Lacisediminihabitans sp. TaxID=2787631 RepID=UPI00374DF84A
MTLSGLRRLAVQRGALGRTILLLALVGGVLVGLLAMHTISSAFDGHSKSGSAMSSDMTIHSDHGTMSPTQREVSGECTGMCDPGHSMASMACVLALLFSALVLAISASRQWSMFHTALRARWRALVAVAVAAIPPPPDLNALSISRT